MNMMLKLKPVPHINTVLLVEDYPPARLACSMMLEHLGYNVKTASCGTEAIEIIQASALPFVAILMDVEMHDIDGFKVTKVIRKLEEKKGYSNSIIAVTCHALSGDRELCLQSGMNDYISKPINATILAQKLHQLVNL